MSNPNKDSGNPLDFGLENLDVQETLGKTTDFFQANKSRIILSGIILLVLAGTSYGVFGVFLPNRQEEAQNMMYMAERYFENDSLTLAINGDGNFPGFLEIESDYSWTDAGRLARYYLWVSYLRQGEYDEAIRWLEKFSSDDVLLAKKLLQWEPKVDRADGLRITYDYFRSLPEEELYKEAHGRTFERK